MPTILKPDGIGDGTHHHPTTLKLDGIDDDMNFNQPRKAVKITKPATYMHCPLREAIAKTKLNTIEDIEDTSLLNFWGAFSSYVILPN